MDRSSRIWRWLFSFSVFVAPDFAQNSSINSSAPAITIPVDATDAPRKIIHAQLAIPAALGTLTLSFPKWIPGEHGPTGPVEELTGLKVVGNGAPLKWRR